MRSHTRERDERKMGKGWERNGRNGERFRGRWETDGGEGSRGGIIGVKMGNYGSACESSPVFLTWTQKQQCSQMETYLESVDILSDCLNWNMLCFMLQVLKAKTAFIWRKVGCSLNASCSSTLHVCHFSFLQRMTQHWGQMCVSMLFTFAKICRIISYTFTKWLTATCSN